MRWSRSNSTETAEIVQATTQAILGVVQPHLLVLYGSEARGEATPESDVDILVVLDKSNSELVGKVRSAVYRVMWDRDFARLISLNIMSRERYERQSQQRYSLMANIEADGVVLWPAGSQRLCASLPPLPKGAPLR